MDSNKDSNQDQQGIPQPADVGPPWGQRSSPMDHGTAEVYRSQYLGTYTH